MPLDRVTFTGADDSVRADDLIALSREFPFVEWGLLYSRSQQGAPRFPSPQWLSESLPRLRDAGAGLAAHLCGGYVRAWVRDGQPWWPVARLAAGSPTFQRLQLNFHGEPLHWSPAFLASLPPLPYDVIFQADAVNDTRICDTMVRHRGTSVLFDTSGGAGLVPRSWPTPWWDDRYVGYAGGLGPATIATQLPRIFDAAGPARFWIDMERGVRSDDDTLFDLDKVRAVLQYCAPLMGA